MTAHSVQSSWGFDSDATFSDDRTHRFRLGRRLSLSETPCRIAFVMLNPSTADESDNDHTIRKCIGFAKRLGHDRIDVVNLFSWCSTDPMELAKVNDPYGDPTNLETILATAHNACMIIAAWGGPYSGQLKRIIAARAWRVADELERGGNELHCLGTTKDGAPRHPLMLSYSSQPIRWRRPS